MHRFSNNHNVIFTLFFFQNRLGLNMSYICHHTDHAISHHAGGCGSREGHDWRRLRRHKRANENTNDLYNNGKAANPPCVCNHLTVTLDRNIAGAEMVSTAVRDLCVTMETGFQVVDGAALGCQLVPPVILFSPGWLQCMSLQIKTVGVSTSLRLPWKHKAAAVAAAAQ